MAMPRVYMGADRNDRKPPPDRFCVNKDSEWYRPLPMAIRIALNGVEQHGTVVEYCVSAGWARVHVLVNGKPIKNMLGTDWRNRRLDGQRISVWWADQPIPSEVVQHA